MRLRNVCFTLNNWTDEEYQSVLNLSYKYLIVAKEVAETGTPHLQGYVEFKNAIKFSTLKKKMPRARFTKRDGTPKQAAGYCKKGEDSKDDGKSEKWFDKPGKNAIFFEDGEISQQGKRTDIDNVVDLINDGNSMKDIAKLEPKTFVKYNKGFMALKQALIEPRSEKPIVQVFYGPTGTGKSYSARELMKSHDIDYYVWTPARGKWWDGYDGHEGVIMEEFRGVRNLPMSYLLVLLDRYECPVEYKGGTCEFIAKRIIITSPTHPRDWYKHDESDGDKVKQLLRRIDSIQLFDTEVNDTEVVG